MTQSSGCDDRLAAAARRADELHQLRTRLAAGEELSADDVTLARERADEAAERARKAHGRAAEAHHQAAVTHRVAAEAAERAGDQALARRHRQAADADEVEAAQDLRAAVAEPVPRRSPPD